MDGGEQFSDAATRCFAHCHRAHARLINTWASVSGEGNQHHKVNQLTPLIILAARCRTNVASAGAWRRRRAAAAA